MRASLCTQDATCLLFITVTLLLAHPKDLEQCCCHLVVAPPAPPGAPLENVRLVLCLVCNLLMQIMLGNADQHRPAMQFDSFEDGRQWYKDARAMAPELLKTMSGGSFEWVKLLATNPIWAAKFVGSIMPEVIWFLRYLVSLDTFSTYAYQCV